MRNILIFRADGHFFPVFHRVKTVTKKRQHLSRQTTTLKCTIILCDITEIYHYTLRCYWKIPWHFAVLLKYTMTLCGATKIYHDTLRCYWNLPWNFAVLLKYTMILCCVTEIYHDSSRCYWSIPGYFVMLLKYTMILCDVTEIYYDTLRCYWNELHVEHCAYSGARECRMALYLGVTKHESQFEQIFADLVTLLDPLCVCQQSNMLASNK